MDERLSRMAQLLVNYCIDTQPGERVGLMASIAAAPLVLELQRYVLRAGGYPYTKLSIPGSEYIFYSEASDEQLSYVPETTRLYFEEFEGLIGIDSSLNTKELTNVDPERQVIPAKALSGIMQRYQERSAKGEFKWVRSVFPTPALAQDAEMSLKEFEDFVYASMYLDQEDPVLAWRAQGERQQRLVDWLHGKHRVAIEGPNVDLSLSIEARRFINSAGSFNMPDGEIYTSPIEDSAEGWIRFSYPAVMSGKEVAGVELTFEAGKVVQASAEKNERFLKASFEVDEGASRVGEFAIGTNSQINRFTKNILFDEKIGGTIHLALGSGFPEVGGTIESGIHWDMICDMKDGGRIFVDGELFYDSGQFVVLGG
jgi:aminopeptidase